MSKIELPKSFGADQAAYSNAASINKESAEALEKRFEEEEKFAFKNILFAAQHPDIDNPKSSTDLAMLNSSFNQNRALISLGKSMNSLLQQKEDAALRENSDLKGQILHIDDSTRQYAGGGAPVKFNYEIIKPDFLTPAQRAEKANLRIKILDEKGNIVYTKNITSVEKNNSFTWNGETLKGKTADKGTYKIEVDASIGDGADQKGKIPLMVSTTIELVIDDVRRDFANKVMLVAGGELIAPGDVKIKKITAQSEAISNDKLVPYINKQGKINLSEATISHGIASVNYFNSVENPGKTSVHLYSGGKFEKTIEYNGKISDGLGSLKIDCFGAKIPDGKYTCKLVVEDKDNNNAKVELPGSKEIVIEAIDFKTGEIVSQGQKFSHKLIEELSSMGPAESDSLITQSGFYIGKQVKYADNRFNFDKSLKTGVRIPSSAAGTTLGEVQLKIYKDDKLVAQVNKPAVEVYSKSKIPMYSELNNESKALVDQYIVNSVRMPNIQNYNDLTSKQQLEINQYIENQFLAGNYFFDGQVVNDQTKLKNMGIVELAWDGTLLDGTMAKPEEELSYKIFSSVLDSNNIPSYNELKTLKTSSVVSTTVENQEILLHLIDGNIRSVAEIESIA